MQKRIWWLLTSSWTTTLGQFSVISHLGYCSDLDLKILLTSSSLHTDSSPFSWIDTLKSKSRKMSVLCSKFCHSSSFIRRKSQNPDTCLQGPRISLATTCDISDLIFCYLLSFISLGCSHVGIVANLWTLWACASLGGFALAVAPAKMLFLRNILYSLISTKPLPKCHLSENFSAYLIQNECSFYHLHYQPFLSCPAFPANMLYHCFTCNI